MKYGVCVIISLISVLVLSFYTDARIVISRFMFDEMVIAEQVLLYVMVPLVLGLPMDAFYGQTRFFFLKTLVRLTFPIQVFFLTRKIEKLTRQRRA